MTTGYLGLGANLGDRRANLQAGLDALPVSGLRLLRVSPVYETEPVDVRDQPWFLNLVAEIRTALPPRELLARTQWIEQRAGRRRTIPKGPRTLDIDILFYGRLIIDEPGLAIPHPRLPDRRFVLAPLADLAPGFRDPRSGRTVRELLAAAPPGQEVRRLEDPLTTA